jgi:hypothetical protein
MKGYIPIDLVLEMVNRKEKFNGEIPDEIFEGIRKDKESMANAFINIVNRVKKNISDMIINYSIDKQIITDICSRPKRKINQ